jgi:hypothetical protein
MPSLSKLFSPTSTVAEECVLPMCILPVAEAFNYTPYAMQRYSQNRE